MTNVLRTDRRTDSLKYKLVNTRFLVILGVCDHDRSATLYCPSFNVIALLVCSCDCIYTTPFQHIHIISIARIIIIIIIVSY